MKTGNVKIPRCRMLIKQYENSLEVCNTLLKPKQREFVFIWFVLLALPVSCTQIEHKNGHS